jgi:hypothetical protein
MRIYEKKRDLLEIEKFIPFLLPKITFLFSPSNFFPHTYALEICKLNNSSFFYFVFTVKVMLNSLIGSSIQRKFYPNSV